MAKSRDVLLDCFALLLGNFMKENDIQVSYNSSAGTLEWDIDCEYEDLGPLVYANILYQIISVTILKFDDFIPEKMTEDFIDSILDMAKKNVMGILTEAEKDA